MSEMTKKLCPSLLKKNPPCSQLFQVGAGGIQQTLLFPATGLMAGVGLGSSVLWVSTSSISLLQLSKVTTSAPRTALPPSDQEVRDSSGAALGPNTVGTHLEQRKGEFLPLPHARAGQEGQGI